MPSTGTGLLRPKFFERQQLTPADLTLGVDYGRERLRRHNRYLHGWGAVCGALVNKTNHPWQVQISEGYVVTPHGDEVYLAPATNAYDIQVEATKCLSLDPPCPEPENLEDERVVKILRANLDPLGKDIHGDYNREWLQIKVLRAINLNGFVIQHTIYPRSNRAAFVTYYTFKERTPFAAGTIIRIHSGAEANHAEANYEGKEAGIEHRYVADPGERGNWQLNNPFDTIRILDVTGRTVDQRDLERQLVYLTVSPNEQDLCPQPAVPEKCQPPGSVYAFSRTREGHRFALVCQLPPSHQDDPSCATLEGIVCRNAVIPCPPTPVNNDNAVVLAVIAVSDEGIIEIDNESARRQLLSESLLQAYLRCQCQAAPPAGRITSIIPAEVQQTGQTMTQPAVIVGEGLAGATQVLFAGSGILAQVVNNSDATRLEIVLMVAAEAVVGQYAFFVIFPDNRAALQSADFSVFLKLVAGTLPTLPTIFTPPTFFTIPTFFTQPTFFTLPTFFTQPTFFTLPTFFTRGPIEPPIVIDLDPNVFDLERGRSEPVNVLPTIGEARTRQLRDAGITNVVEFATAPVERLTQVLGISQVRVAALQDAARTHIRKA